MLKANNFTIKEHQCAAVAVLLSVTPSVLAEFSAATGGQ